MSIHISIVVATFNRAELLREALHSVAACQGIDWNRVELIVVDNNSPDHTGQVVADIRAAGFPCAMRYVKEMKQGVSCARNRGAHESVGRYVAFMDDDQRIDPGYLAPIEKVFEQTGADVIGGPLRYYNANGIPSWLTPLLENVGQFDAGESGRPLNPRVEFLRGGNMVVQKAQFLALGGFDVRLGRCGDSLMSDEEAEFQYRLTKAEPPGTVWYSPQLIQYHYLRPRRLTRAYWRQHRFDRGRSEYRSRHARDMQSRQRSVFNLPFWMLKQLVVRELPNYLKALPSPREERFAAQLRLCYHLGQLVEARHQSKTMRNQSSFGY